MLKIIALLILIWVFFKAMGMIFRTVIGGPDVNRNTRFDNSRNRQSKQDGDIRVEHDPNKTNKGYEGGEYVDYEEVD